MLDKVHLLTEHDGNLQPAGESDIADVSNHENDRQASLQSAELYSGE